MDTSCSKVPIWIAILTYYCTLHRLILVSYIRTVEFSLSNLTPCKREQSCELRCFVSQTSKYAKIAASDIPAAGSTAFPALPAVVSDGVVSAAAPEADGVVVAEADPEGADPEALSSA